MISPDRWNIPPTTTDGTGPHIPLRVPVPISATTLDNLARSIAWLA
ncbi:MAG: hypothetical protein ACI9BK_001392 [Acidimicrobiales bacterium]